ncbi:hypothetical protein NEOC84_001251|nr:hypothetical protein [Neochlamydia sp. AcF84]
MEYPSSIFPIFNKARLFKYSQSISLSLKVIDLKKARSFFYLSCFYSKNPLLLAAQS